MGAPQAAGHGQLRGSRPGALFRCPITPEEYDCERVDIDGDGEFVPSVWRNSQNLATSCLFAIFIVKKNKKNRSFKQNLMCALSFVMARKKKPKKQK